MSNEDSDNRPFEEATQPTSYTETEGTLPVPASVLANMKRLGNYQGNICPACQHKEHEPGKCGRQMSEDLQIFECHCGEPAAAAAAANDHLSAEQRAYIALDKRKAEVKKFFDDLEAATAALVEAHGVGHLFQDDEGTVYKTAIPEGRFVYYEKFTVNRTRRLSDGEKAGSLSMTEARAAGFEVEGK